MALRVLGHAGLFAGHDAFPDQRLDPARIFFDESGGELCQRVDVGELVR